jgi:hypothetical protein
MPRRNKRGNQIAAKHHFQHTNSRPPSEGFLDEGAERVVGPKSEEVVGKWRKLCNEELHNLCFSSDTY